MNDINGGPQGDGGGRWGRSAVRVGSHRHHLRRRGTILRIVWFLSYVKVNSFFSGANGDRSDVVFGLF